MLTPLPPPPPRDLGPRLQRLGAQAAAIVLLGLFGFGLAGLFVDTDSDAGEPVASPSTQPSATTSPTAAGSTAGPTADPATSPDATSPSDTAPSSDAASPTPDATASSPTDEPPATETSDDGRMDPGSIRIQVLDGVGDGGAAANDVASELRAAGYNVVVVNQASRRYDVTTVFYTDGHVAAGEQVADEFGWSVVEPKPDNLSSSVELHIVVGTDRT